MNPENTDTAKITKIAAEAISDRKGLDLVIFDANGLSDLADYIIIASALNPPHLKALVNSTLATLKKHGEYCYRKSGLPDSGWVIVDYTDVIIHLFIKEQREYYDLDDLFKDVPKVNL